MASLREIFESAEEFPDGSHGDVGLPRDDGDEKQNYAATFGAAKIPWKEELHPRAADGKFGTGGRIKSAVAKKRATEGAPGAQQNRPKTAPGGKPNPGQRPGDQPELPQKPPQAPQQPAGDPLQSLVGMFSDDELRLPDKVPQPQNTEEAVYTSAERNQLGYRQVLNMGKGLSRDIGASVVEVKSAEDFQALMQSFESGQPGPVIVFAPLKGRKRAAEKVNGKYQGDWSALQDVVRGTVAVDKVGEIPGVVAGIKKHLALNGWTISAKPNDRMTQPIAGGYRDVQLSLQAPDGQQTELQINVKSMIVAKEGQGHQLYEQYRSIKEKPQQSPVEEKQLAQLEQAMEQVYANAWAKAQ